MIFDINTSTARPIQDITILEVEIYTTPPVMTI
jgi:hypothetical protein